jgi:broad specificity phosphatase PhoE
MNQQKRLCGHINISLSADGIQYAMVAHNKIKELKLNYVLSSPLKRAVQTATILTGLTRKEIIIEQLCIERNFGLLDGLPYNKIREKFPKISYIKAGNNFYSLNPPHGESLKKLHIRANNFKLKVLEKYKNQSILIVSHQTFLKVFHGTLRGLDERKSLAVDLLNLELNRFVVTKNGKVVYQDRYFLLPVQK